MNIQDFVTRVASEPERTVSQPVSAPLPSVLVQATKPGGLKLTDLVSASEPPKQQRRVSYRHVLGSPASHEAIAAWQRQHSSHPLPADLRELLLRMNGIHLWAQAGKERAYVGLAPIEEWELARTKMYGPSADPSLLDDRYVAITYHQDGASFVVLDVQSGRYFLMDTAGPDAKTPIAKDAGGLLNWLWQHRIAPKE